MHTNSPPRRRPDVSIIVITHNQRENLLAALASIDEFAGDTQVETLIVDNGSTDGTVAAVRKSAPGVQVVERLTNEGFPARNHGLRQARGRMRMFLDSDARLTEGALPELVKFLDDHPDVGLVGPRLIYPDGRFQPSARRLPSRLLPLARRPPLRSLLDDSAPVRRHLMLDTDLSRTREVEYLIGACQLFTEAAHQAVGEIDRRIFYGPDDADWCVRIRRAGFKVAYHPAATVVHEYQRLSNRRLLSSVSLRHARGFAYFQRKWRSAWPELREAGGAIDARDGRLD